MRKPFLTLHSAIRQQRPVRGRKEDLRAFWQIKSKQKRCIMLQDILDLMGDRLLDNSSRGAFDGSFKAGSQEIATTCQADALKSSLCSFILNGKSMSSCLLHMNDSWRSQETTRVTWQHIHFTV